MPRLSPMSARVSALVTGLILCAGCGSGKPKPVPVSGSLTVKKVPADGALVRLWPVDAEGPNVVRPLGYVQHDGSFQLTTYAENDGAPPGKYKVTIEWRPKKKTTMEADGPDRLEGRYADPEQSTIEVVVNSSTTRLEPMNLD